MRLRYRFALAEIITIVFTVLIFNIIEVLGTGYVFRELGLTLQELAGVTVFIMIPLAILIGYIIPVLVFNRTIGMWAIGIKSERKLSFIAMPGMYLSLGFLLHKFIFITSDVIAFLLYVILAVIVIKFITTKFKFKKSSNFFLPLIISIIVIAILLFVTPIITDDMQNSDTGFMMYRIDKLDLLATKKEFGTNDLVEIQENVDEDIEKEITNGNYTIENPYVELNPYNRNKLSAYVIIPTDDEVTYEYTVKGKTEDTSFTYSSNEAKNTPWIPVVGLYANYNNEVSITLTHSDGTKEETNVLIDTTVLNIPESSQTAEITVYDEEAFNETKGSFIIDTEYNAYDMNGDLRTYDIAPRTYSSDPLKMVNGKHFIYGNRAAYETYIAPGYMYEMDLMGRVKETMQAPEGYGFHHDMLFLDGIYYVLGGPLEHNISMENKGESYVFMYDEDYNYIGNYNMSFITDGVDEQLFNELYENIHVNSIDYSERLDQFIFSMRGLSSIVAIDRQGEVKWVIDPAGFISEDFPHLQIVGDNFNEMSGQHSAYVYDDAQNLGPNQEIVIIFDNNSCFAEDGTQPKEPVDTEDILTIKMRMNGENICQVSDTETVAYKIDFDKMTVETVNDIMYENSPSEFTGNVQLLSDGYVGTYASIGTSIYYVVDKDGNIAYQVDIPGSTVVFYRGWMYSPEEVQEWVEL